MCLTVDLMLCAARATTSMQVLRSAEMPMAPQWGFIHAELLRENKRLIDKSIREIDRERMSLQNQENKLIMEMKKNAKNGQMVRMGRVLCRAAQRRSNCCALCSQAQKAPAIEVGSSTRGTWRTREMPGVRWAKHAGFCQSAGQVVGAKSTIRHQDASHESQLASSVAQDHGAMLCLPC
jgi:hypothetical protein